MTPEDTVELEVEGTNEIVEMPAKTFNWIQDDVGDGDFIVGLRRLKEISDLAESLGDGDIDRGLRRIGEIGRDSQP